jgi:hypothetical protein
MSIMSTPGGEQNQSCDGRRGGRATVVWGCERLLLNCPAEGGAPTPVERHFLLRCEDDIHRWLEKKTLPGAEDDGGGEP